MTTGKAGTERGTNRKVGCPERSIRNKKCVFSEKEACLAPWVVGREELVLRGGAWMSCPLLRHGLSPHGSMTDCSFLILSLCLL